LEKEIEAFLAAVPARAGSAEQFGEVRRRWKIEAADDLFYLPHLEAPRSGKKSLEYPYHLLSYELLSTRCGAGANLPLLQELFGLYTREYWNSWAEINPETAERLGIHDGDHVNIISPKGNLQVKAKILPTVMPEVVMVPFGLGHRRPGRDASRIGVNPHEIFAEDTDALSGIASLISTKVRIEKVVAV
jgi:anaerobic selenocysteine-containing dehydrogenase